ncbi:MAG TPA: hypothetical protein DDZ41_03940 [Flavobacterium sp.]|nr:hypothetical protein [Flavobacterium sp.]
MKIRQLISISTVTLLLFSCNQNRIEGTYYYVKPKIDNSSFYTMGRDIACSSIGQFEFKDGKCYINIMGIQKRFDYEIDNNIIYLQNYNNSNETGLTIIDENTINFSGCIFSKNNESFTTENTKSETEKPIIEKGTEGNNTISKDYNISNETKVDESALVKDIFQKNGKTFISLDIVQLEYKEIGYKVINQNDKVRIFEISDELVISDKNCKEIKDNNYILKNKEIIISKSKNDICMFTSKNGVITNLNLGCWN